MEYENEYIINETMQIDLLEKQLKSLESKWFKTATKIKEINMLKEYIKLKKILVIDLDNKLKEIKKNEN